MHCVICKQGETQPGETTVTLQRGDTTVVVKAVPAEVCENCEEGYLAADVSARVLQRAERAVANGAEVEVVRYAA